MWRPWYLLSVVAAVALAVTLARVMLAPTSSAPLSLTSPITSESAPTLLAAVGTSTGPALGAAGAAASVTSAAALTAAASALRGALVNIICLTPAGSPYHSISASGVFITPAGYILTSAHVAAYFLLTDKRISCFLRVGDPAHTAYRAQLVYLPEAWVVHNAHLLLEQNPAGTGEYDFAIIAISGSATSAPLPATFPALPLAEGETPLETPVVVGSYGAQNLSLAQIESALSPTIAASAVKSLFTFDDTTVDVLGLGGSAAAQEGSSGGGVVNLNDKLVGSITTSTLSGTIASRMISAVSASYVRREYRAETGARLNDLLATPPATAVKNFAGEAARLGAQMATST